jgi:hypothetical protein
MELIKLNQELMKQYERLEREKTGMFDLGRNKAETERQYRKALMQEIFKLRDQKVPATLINDLARGTVADLKFERDLADVTYRSGLASLEATRSQSSILKQLHEKQEEV